MTSDEVLREELGDDMVDVAHVDPVDDRLAQGITKETLVLSTAVAWRAQSRARTRSRVDAAGAEHEEVSLTNPAGARTVLPRPRTTFKL